MTHSTAQFLSVGASMAGESGRSLTGLARELEHGPHKRSAASVLFVALGNPGGDR